MQLFYLIVFAFALIWAFRIEKNTAKTSEALQRIEQLLKERKGKDK